MLNSICGYIYKRFQIRVPSVIIIPLSIKLFSIHALFLWSIKCQKMGKYVVLYFPKSSNVSFCPQPKDL